MVNGYSGLKKLKYLLLLVTCFVVLPAFTLSGQNENYSFFYRVYFVDKGPGQISDFSATQLLSSLAIEKREKAELPLLDFTDLPVYQGYINQIKSMGFVLHTESKWMNTALFKTEAPTDLGPVRKLSFVKDVKIVKNKGTKNEGADKFSSEEMITSLPSYDQPLLMLKGTAVHNSGFTGKGILIAVLDGGFYNAENISSLKNLRNRGGIAGTYDFVEGNQFIYGFHDHGTAVLSVLAGSLNGEIEGSAPDATYWLFRTEDTGSEFPVEEDFWVSAAEFADSIGVDIISSSLGYSTFDDPTLDYKYSDFDGDKAFITKAADMAASKGILVVNSAGNERDKQWVHIIAPSDGDSVLSVGAVDWTNTISSFSSAGPSFDRRIKPDVVAPGVYVPVQSETSVVKRASGTSFSCPLISGMCACIMQAVPSAGSYDIITALRSSADRFTFPDSLYGYGLPDIPKAIKILQEKYLPAPENNSVAGPNPFNHELKITFREIPEKLSVEIFNITGKLLYKIDYTDYISRTITLNEFGGMGRGIYFVRLKTPGGTFVHKVIKNTEQDGR